MLWVAKAGWAKVWARTACLCFLAGFVSAAHAEPILLQQSFGGTLQLEQPARRVITLSPHLTELVFDAGAGETIVATVEYSNWPPQAEDIPRVGDAFRIDAERVQLLKPDLVIGWETGNPGSALAGLADLGLKVWSLEIRTPGEIAETLEAVGRALGTAETAEVAASKVRRQLEQLSTNYANRPAVRYFYQISAQPLYTVNGEHLISQGLALCGGENVFAALSGLAPQIGQEAVLLADPDALLAPDIPGADDPFAQWRSWARMKAVRQQKFLKLPADAISRATPRFLDAVKLACSRLDEIRANGDSP